MSYYRTTNNYGRNVSGNRYRSKISQKNAYTVSPIIRVNEPLAEFKKNFLSDQTIMSEDEINLFRKNNEMKLFGTNIPAPVLSFKDLNFSEELVNFFEVTKGWEFPTPIQSQGWPMALSGRDMIGIAATGSGKTFSFLVPAYIHAADQPLLREGDGPIVIVLAPTRELATQIGNVATELSQLKTFNHLRSLCIYGGANIFPQKKALVSGIEILIATPGRLIDLHNQGFCPLNRCTFLVLDEADRMLDMGFEPQLNQIIPKINAQRQTLMWSATWPKEVKSLAYRYTSQDAIQVIVGDEELKVNEKIEQRVEIVSNSDKEKKLLYTLQDFRDARVLIFCNKKSTCDKLERLLLENRFRGVALHGDKSQHIRDMIFDNFKKGRDPILIATDVAARGLDVKDIHLVINYDLPTNLEDYVHRVGRTARGTAKEGKALTFFSLEEDSGLAKRFIELLKKGNVVIPDELLNIKPKYGNDRSKYNGFRSKFKHYNNNFYNRHYRN